MHKPETNIKVKEGLDEDTKYRMKAGAFLCTVAGIASISGFGRTILSAKKKDPQMFNKGVAGSLEMTETGAHLAMRALGWGTLYAFLGTGLFCYGAWKLSGATNLVDFREKMGAVLPKVRKNDPPQSRTEFEGLTDFLKYLSSWTKE